MGEFVISFELAVDNIPDVEALKKEIMSCIAREVGGVARFGRFAIRDASAWNRVSNDERLTFK